ncbi:hypothetical protein CEE36_00045 [candidate division TA06 bacterium B3_TA06]|uniref:Uncharacterized protein n=1 Tax=candidate division TA06 bacterium B3_TA06 TaxID=2012487 RepID=A0A532VAD8_UNCT6|nr:MAG: hypothetical protein CEE36_00045 [candidate division TA06 bacterium B3_TA06]
MPPSSIFFASGRFVLSTFVLGDLDVDRRSKAYRRVVEVILKRSQELAVGDVRVKHSRLSREIVGSAFPPYSFPKPPNDLSPATSFPDIIAEQELLHGKLEEADKLKLIFQAVYGGEHLLSNPEEAWRCLQNEWDFLRPESKAGEKCDTGECVTGTGVTGEPLAERISPEGGLYRINLRPCKELGIDLRRLFEAVKRSAEGIANDRARREARLLPQALSVGIEPDKVPKGPFHHSKSYRERISPAYRLIRAAEIAGLLTSLN